MWWFLACSSPGPDPTTGWGEGVTIAPDPTPARFSGPLTLAWAVDHRPLEAVRHAVCTDRPGARDALLAAVAATPEPDRTAWTQVTAQTDCADPGYCAWLHERIRAGVDLDLWHVALWSCTDEVSARVFLESAPDDIVRSYVESAPRRGYVVPWSDRFERLLDHSSEGYLRGLGQLADPRGRQLLRKLGERSTDAARARAYAALDGSLDAGEALLAERACADLGRPCVGRTALSDLSAAVAGGLDPRRLAEAYPNLRTALGQSLADCIGGPDPWAAHTCAEALAALDPAATAAAITSSPHADTLRDLVTDPVATDLALAGCGFVVPAGTTGVTAAARLEAAGAATRVRAVGSDDPGQGLPYRLSALAGLDDAEYDVLAPTGFPGDRALLGWRGRVRHRVLTSAEGWDVVAATRLVNAQLAFAERPERLVPDVTYTTWVLGSPDALRCLADSGLATFASTPEPSPAEEVSE